MRINHPLRPFDRLRANGSLVAPFECPQDRPFECPQDGPFVFPQDRPFECPQDRLRANGQRSTFDVGPRAR